MKVSKFIAYGGWLFCGVLLFRLVFADRGVVDYYQKQEMINNKVYRMESLKAENSDLEKEITRINDDSSYQKKLVRKHLGVIASDEYLVLFARDRRHLSK